jgi:PAS domain S-box-containing protein
MIYALVIIASLVAAIACILAIRFAASARRSAFEVEELKEKLAQSAQGVIEVREDIESPKLLLVEDTLKRLNLWHELILDTAIEGVIGIDWQGSITFVNPAAAKMLERDAKELVGQPIQIITHPSNTGNEFDQTLSPIYSSLTDGLEYRVSSELFWRKDGSTFPVEYVCVPIKEDDAVLGGVLTFEDITERKDLEEAAAKARDAAIESARLKSEFLANVSHEIRTPMNGILGMTEILLDSDLTASQRRTAETISSSANALLEIVNDILDLSRIESGKLRFEPRDFKLRDVIQNVIDFFSESARAKSIELNFSVDENLSDEFHGDDGRLRQILINLIGNAIKFTDDGYVSLSITKENETDKHATIHFTVSDTGPGIAEHEQQRLFQPFSQVNYKIARKHGGTGLGLAISKQTVELMGGQIGVVSEEGKGSTFWFTVNLEKQLERTSIDSQRQSQTELGNFVSELPVSSIEDFSQLKVLVAEDNPVNQQVALHFLQRLGIAAEVAANGFEVLNALSRAAYDMVLMDCQMPEVGGFEATQLIRESDGINKNITIIAMTANAMQGDRERCLAAGMNDYIAKPIVFDELRKTIAKYFSDDSEIHVTLDQVMDTKVLDNLHALEQNRLTHIAAEVLETYLSHAPTCLRDLQTALEKGDAEAIANAAHSLKGSSSTLGMKQMTELCASLEAKGRNKDLKGAPELLNQAKEEFEKIRQAIVNTEKA